MRSGVVFAVGIALAVFFSATAFVQSSANGATTAVHPAVVLGPTTGKASPEVSIPVRELARHEAGPAHTIIVPRRVNPLQNEADQGRRGTWTRGRPPLDPLIHSSQNPPGFTPPPDIVFGGSANPAACNGCAPPDTNGDTDGQYFIQAVNATKIGIYDKSGNLVAPAFDLGSLWSSGPCTGNVGDPQVRYDRLAGRWVLAQIENKEMCFAVSQTADPMGVYNLYTFEIGDLPDYFKLGVWQNAYYVGTNEKTYAAYALDRAAMLAGQSAVSIKFSGETNFLMPADADGTDWPSDAGYFYTFKDDKFHGGKDRIELFRLTPNFKNTQKSTFKLDSTFNIASFTYTVCGFFKTKCIPQGGTKQKVDAVSEWPMQRFAYRKMGKTWQELVGDFTVGGGKGPAGAAVRWFELRNSGKGWKLWQEGTQDLRDGHDRFMGSIAMDKDGNIALGYSASGKNDFPSIRYATRRSNDPLGTLGPEYVLKPGAGAQTGSDRWGDYSGMSVDPADGCRFWYTNEYYPTSSGSNWATAIGAFAFPTCEGGPLDSVRVPGTANPFYAGRSDTGGDGTVPPQSSMFLTAGATLTFQVTGGASYGGGCPDSCFPPDGDGGSYSMIDLDATTGIAGMDNGPAAALIGVFLDDSAPVPPAPPRLDFSVQDFSKLKPQLRQMFFIGDGRTGSGSGKRQQFIVPKGATRLFLAVSDGSGWYNNSGEIDATITETTR